jgi:spore coat protein CotH
VKSRLGSKEEGNLFESDQTGGTLQDRGDDKASYRTLYELKTNEDADDYTGLLRFIAVLNRTPEASFQTEIEKVLDVPSALAYLAVNNFCLNIDSYVGLAHNYYMYERKSDGKFTFFAWDGNLAWGGLSFGVNGQQLPALATDWTQQAGQRPLLTRLLAVPEYKAAYDAVFHKLQDGVGRRTR